MCRNCERHYLVDNPQQSPYSSTQQRKTKRFPDTAER
nr:MAG TPA: hypothetical protein [Caudoviricetes sp.]